MNFGMFERESDPFPILLSTNRKDATRGPSGIKRSCCPQRPAISYLFELTFASSVDILRSIESASSASSASSLADSRPGSSVKARSCWSLHASGSGHQPYVQNNTSCQTVNATKNGCRRLCKRGLESASAVWQVESNWKQCFSARFETHEVEEITGRVCRNREIINAAWHLGC